MSKSSFVTAYTLFTSVTCCNCLSLCPDLLPSVLQPLFLGVERGTVRVKFLTRDRKLDILTMISACQPESGGVAVQIHRLRG